MLLAFENNSGHWLIGNVACQAGRMSRWVERHAAAVPRQAMHTCLTPLDIRLLLYNKGKYVLLVHCYKRIRIMNNFTPLQQLTACLDEAVLREGQPTKHAWRSLYCEGSAVEVLLTPTAEFRYLSHVSSCLYTHGAECFVWLSTC